MNRASSCLAGWVRDLRVETMSPEGTAAGQSKRLYLGAEPGESSQGESSGTWQNPAVCCTKTSHLCFENPHKGPDSLLETRSPVKNVRPRRNPLE